MLICDTHADTLWAMQDPSRDAALPFHITRERLLGTDDVRVQALALFTGNSGLADEPDLIFRELQMLEVLKGEGFRQIARLEDALPGEANILLTVEGGEVFHGGIHTVEHYASLGVRAAALVWNNVNELAYPAVKGSSPGLTPQGKKVAGRMHALGMAVDVSHMSAQGVEDVLSLGGPPPMASHSCAHALCPHPRNLTDEQLRAVFSAGGYVGIAFYPPFLDPSGKATLDTVVDHMVHLCELGGQGHVGLGSDFDGIEIWPEGLAHAGELPNLFAQMRKRGFDEPLVRAIAGENFAAYLTRITAAATQGPFCQACSFPVSC
ncbi:MAG: membrane dipeptidase [Clostridiales bacterium]|nr:membrane dipeptidase [Clostridiales bacterium]